MVAASSVTVTRVALDENGLPGAIIDVALVQKQIADLYGALVGEPGASGDDIAQTVADAGKAAGPAAGVVVLNAIVRLLHDAVAPLSFKLGVMGASPDEIWDLVKPK